MRDANLVRLVTDVYKFYRAEVTPFTLQVWQNAMQNFEFEHVSKAFSAHLANAESGQYLPKPADIVKALQGTQTDRAALAWGKVMDAASSVGAYTDVAFDDPAIHAAIEDMGGWPKVARTEQKELSYTMHRFCEQYKAYTGRGEFGYPAQLKGDRSPDSEYAKRGLPIPRPKLIGIPERCNAVMQGAKQKTMITDAGKLASLLLETA